jgi:hypothetical protein
MLICIRVEVGECRERKAKGSSEKVKLITHDVSRIVFVDRLAIVGVGAP